MVAVGRFAELWDIHTALTGSDFAIIAGSSGTDLARVLGMGGIGKTLLAEEYARRFGSAYPGGIFWLSCSLGDGVLLPADELEPLRTTQMSSIATGLELSVEGKKPAEIDAAVTAALRVRVNRYLWWWTTYPSARLGIPCCTGRLRAAMAEP